MKKQTIYCLGCGSFIEGRLWMGCKSRSVYARFVKGYSWIDKETIFSVVKCWHPVDSALAWNEKEEV